MREVLSKYLLTFKRMYPTHPPPETWEVYERVLSDINDMDLSAACEICIRELTYYPMPAEIRERLKKTDPPFTGTSSFDTSADFVPVRDWFEAHTKTHHLHVWMDKYGRKKVDQVLASEIHKLETWPQHWGEKNAQPITWEQAREQIGKLVKAKTL